MTNQSMIGARVYGISKTEANLASLKAEAPEVTTICQDISDWRALRAAMDDWPVMDGVVNNAGIGIHRPFLDITPEQFDAWKPF